MKKQKENWFDNVENRPHPWAGLTWLTTTIYVADVDKAVEFYTQVMDMVSILEMKGDDGVLSFARIRYRGSNFIIEKALSDIESLSSVDSHLQPPFVFYLYVDDVRALAENMKMGGATIVHDLEVQNWGDLKARFRDPFGCYWDIAEKV